MAVTLKQLTYFVALAEEGSFGRAAARVHISQPALSLQIKEMEATLDVLLIDRLPREARLTRAGREVLTRARRILAEVGDLTQAVRWREGLAGQLNLGVIPTVAPYLLPLALTRLRARDITLDIRVREAQTETLVAELREGVLDAAVAALPLGAPGLVAEPLFQDRFLLAGSAARLAAVRPTRPEDVSASDLLLLDDGHCLADQALEVCGLKGSGRVNLGASSLATLSGLAAEGFGLTLLPEIAAQSEQAAAPGLTLARFAAPEPARQLALVRREGSTDDGWVAELAGILREAGEELVGHAARAIPPCAAPGALDNARASV